MNDKSVNEVWIKFASPGKQKDMNKDEIEVLLQANAGKSGWSDWVELDSGDKVKQRKDGSASVTFSREHTFITFSTVEYDNAYKEYSRKMKEKN